MDRLEFIKIVSTAPAMAAMPVVVNGEIVYNKVGELDRERAANDLFDMIKSGEPVNVGGFKFVLANVTLESAGAGKKPLIRLEMVGPTA